MWLHELRWEDPRVLYDPIVGYRRQGNWVDNGQAYPLTHEGPDLWIAADVPAGMHRVSLYFFNKDGHKAKNRWRDYLLELRTGGDLDPAPKRRMPEGAEDATRVLATARVKDFWGGVYHRFAVRGAGAVSRPRRPERQLQHGGRRRVPRPPVRPADGRRSGSP